MKWIKTKELPLSGKTVVYFHNVKKECFTSPRYYMESEILPESFNKKVKNLNFPIIIFYNPFLYIINSLKHKGVPIYLNHQELVYAGS